MPSPRTRRRVLQIGTLATATATGGCLFGAAQRREPDHGEIEIIDGDQVWTVNKSLRIVARRDGSIALNRSYRLPVDDVELTVEPATYQVSVYLDEKRVASDQWDVTDCRSQLLVSFGSVSTDGVHLDTSDC